MRITLITLLAVSSTVLFACGGGDSPPDETPIYTTISQACPNDPRPEIPIAFIAVSDEEIARVGKAGIYYVCQVPR